MVISPAGNISPDRGTNEQMMVEIHLGHSNVCTCEDKFKVAIIAGNFELAEIIKTHKESDVVPFRETPSYTKRRRILGAGGLSSPRLLQRSASDNNLKAESRASYSPVPSLRSLPPQLLVQMQEAAAAGAGDGSLASSGSARSAHSRSPSLQRVQEEKEADLPTLRRSSRGKAR
ncbi:sh3 and multiple ankyrin repeat domains protein 3 [Limosa lapponica baueri]|uniref:Sh3 and multiple ankyrin repeat domains protein 3 n=1 Tax=Limosa lapponica baueri TaxID=1758121 RepID=A0A2I0TUD0_LIMLA|nr:sh3 and multiple ankyrin repeat domains protein 3 [Limosa lapponica baueri]